MTNHAQTLKVDHYENFPVASWLCPPHLRYPITVIYQFARTADDLADEGPSSSEQRLFDLSEFRSDLSHCAANSGDAYLEHSKWPHIFKPLGAVLKKYNIPTELLEKLLDAFEQDVMYTLRERRYKNRDELLAYCRKSACPIGRIMMHLMGESGEEKLEKSDAICCALQLINFWQDISVDLPRKRFYLPENSSIQEEIEFARELMLKGSSLALTIKGRAGWELRAVVQGGLRIIDKLKHMDPSAQRPQITKVDYALIGWRCMFKKYFYPC